MNSESQMVNKDRAFSVIGHQKASGATVRSVGSPKMVDIRDGAREGTRTPTPEGTGS